MSPSVLRTLTNFRDGGWIWPDQCPLTEWVSWKRYVANRPPISPEIQEYMNKVYAHAAAHAVYIGP